MPVKTKKPLKGTEWTLVGILSPLVHANPVLLILLFPANEDPTSKRAIAHSHDTVLCSANVIPAVKR